MSGALIAQKGVMLIAALFVVFGGFTVYSWFETTRMLAVTAKQLAEASKPLPAPVEFRQPHYTNGTRIKVIIPSRRFEICPGQVERIWTRPNSDLIVSYFDPITRYLPPDGLWHDFELFLTLPPEVRNAGVSEVDLDQRLHSTCNGRPTEVAFIPKLRIKIE